MSTFRDSGSQRREYRNYGGYMRESDDRYAFKRESTNTLLQMSGTGRHVIGIPSEIARACFNCSGLMDRNGQVQLILGVKPNGASELLIPARLSNLRRNGERREVLDVFTSFSPITFVRSEMLEKFLEEHTARNAKKGSRANKGYELASLSQNRDLEHPRCSYERTRTVFRRLLNKLPNDASLYGFSSNYSQGGISQFLLVTHNTYKMRTETGFIDAAWGIVETGPLQESDADPESVRPRVEQDLDFQNEMLAGDRFKNPCKHVATVTVDDFQDPQIRLKQHLQQYYARSTNTAPLCVITHDWAKTKVLLGELGIENSTWSLDLVGLLNQVKSATDREETKYNPGVKKSRSRSPPSREPPSRKRASSSDRQTTARVYVIDTKALYDIVRRSGNPKEGLVEVCRDFDLSEVEEVNPKEMCAGNELQFLWSLFVKIADGPTVDQMFEALFQGKMASTGGDDSDEDEDDEELGGLSGMRAPKRALDPYSFEDDDGLLED